MRRVVVRRLAQAEIAEAFEWYRARSVTAAGEFLAEVDRAMVEIEREPEHFPVVHGRLRRLLLQRFPYGVYFKVYAHSISVVGVIHGHRHPDVWLKRAAP
ncbi:MAG: type II toxin-antitoxin system RelE/ParE family toxin [Gemmatimonadaceae bacterium]|nr:type II toxin-antitoxin system RelE/ParE family toxin [Gemmatimonadaceae bacterium]